MSGDNPTNQQTGATTGSGYTGPGHFMGHWAGKIGGAVGGEAIAGIPGGVVGHEVGEYVGGKVGQGLDAMCERQGQELKMEYEAARAEGMPKNRAIQYALWQTGMESPGDLY